MRAECIVYKLSHFPITFVHLPYYIDAFYFVVRFCCVVLNAALDCEVLTSLDLVQLSVGNCDSVEVRVSCLCIFGAD